MIIIFYLLALIPSALGYMATGVNYDQLSYIPDSVNSKQGEQILETEFDLSGLGLLMARNKKSYEIELLIETLKRIDGVGEIVWLGDYIDIYIPSEFLDQLVIDRFATSETVLLQIRFVENARSPRTGAAVETIQALTVNDADLYFGGEPAILSEMQSSIDSEIYIYSAIAIVMILLVLTASSSHYLDPLFFLVAVGVAIVINMGTNYFQGEISFLTSSIAAVMQLGISLDYAIFLMHRFEEESTKHSEAGDAMAAAVSKTAATVAASAFTTLGGFVALMFMQNGIGRDMGLVLGKGILISLIVTLTFLPGLILVFHKFSTRYKHRIILPSFKRVAPLLARGRWVFLGLFFVIAIPAYLAQNEVEFYFSNENYLPRDSEAVKATAEIMDEYGAVDLVYLITADEGRRREGELAEVVAKVKHVDSVMAISGQVDPAFPEIIIPAEMTTQFQAGGYRNMMIFLSPEADERELFAAVDGIRREAAGLFEHYYLAGPTALTRDMAALSRADAGVVALVSVVAIGLIVAFTQKSLSLPLIMVLSVQLAIWINIGILYFQDQSVSSLTPIIIGAIQLGATVDYAILFTHRYRENLQNIPNRLAAIERTIEETGRPILTSALILFAATFSISIVAGIVTTVEMTMLIGRGAIISMLVMFTLLPALLSICDPLIRATTLGWAQSPSKAVGIKNNK